MTESTTQSDVAPRSSVLSRILLLGVTLGCFAYLYYRLDGAAAREGLSLVEYMRQVFANVRWLPWLALMMVYSGFYFTVDTLVVTKALNWFVKPIRYRDILPIRASAYIISILNEQVGKGAMALYLNRRDGVPAWQVGSSMLFIMVCELLYLCAWANIGLFLQWDNLPPVFRALPWVGVGVMIAFALFYLYFRGHILPNNKFRDGQLLKAFKEATFSQYLIIILLRSPALLLAVVMYSEALALFGVEFGYLQMLGILPVIFFGASVPGPFRAVAVSLWVILFPEHPAEMSAFGLVQHNFFILFNAVIGLLFMGKVQKELFADDVAQSNS